jgi:hypothetical protein
MTSAKKALTSFLLILLSCFAFLVTLLLLFFDRAPFLVSQFFCCHLDGPFRCCGSGILVCIAVLEIIVVCLRRRRFDFFSLFLILFGLGCGSLDCRLEYIHRIE